MRRFTIHETQAWRSCFFLFRDICHAKVEKNSWSQHGALGIPGCAFPLVGDRPLLTGSRRLCLADAPPLFRCFEWSFLQRWRPHSRQLQLLSWSVWKRWSDFGGNRHPRGLQHRVSAQTPSDAGWPGTRSSPYSRSQQPADRQIYQGCWRWVDCRWSDRRDSGGFTKAGSTQGVCTQQSNLSKLGDFSRWTTNHNHTGTESLRASREWRRRPAWGLWRYRNGCRFDGRLWWSSSDGWPWYAGSDFCRREWSDPSCQGGDGTLRGRKLSNFHLRRPGLRVFHPGFDAVEPTQVFRNFNWADVPAFAGPVSPNFWGTAADPVGGAEHGGHPWIHGSIRSSVHCHQSDFAVFHSSDWGCGCRARTDDLLPTQNGWQFQGGFSCLRSQPFGASHCDDELHDCWRVVVLCQRGLGADCRFGYLRRTRGPGGNGTYPDLVACNFGGTTRRATTTLWSQRPGSGWASSFLGWSYTEQLWKTGCQPSQAGDDRLRCGRDDCGGGHCPTETFQLAATLVPRKRWIPPAYPNHWFAHGWLFQHRGAAQYWKIWRTLRARFHESPWSVEHSSHWRTAISKRWGCRQGTISFGCVEGIQPGLERKSCRILCRASGKRPDCPGDVPLLQ